MAPGPQPRPRPRPTAQGSGNASLPSPGAQQVRGGRTYLSAMAALPASGTGCETRSQPRPGAVRPDPGPPAAPRVPLPGVAVLGGSGPGLIGTDVAGVSGEAVDRGLALAAGAAFVESDRVRRAPASRSSGSGSGNESGSGAGTSVLEPRKPYLSNKSMPKVSGRDPFCEESRGLAGHILLSGTLWQRCSCGPQMRPVRAAGSQLHR